MVDSARLTRWSRLGEPDQLNWAMLRVVIVGLAGLFITGLIEWLSVPEWYEVVQPSATAALLIWATVMLYRRRPRPDMLLISGVFLSITYLLLAALAGDVAAISASSPVVIIVATSILSVAGRGRLATMTFPVILVLIGVTGFAIQSTLGHGLVTAAIVSSSDVIVVAMAAVMIRMLRLSADQTAEDYRSALETAPVAIAEVDLSNPMLVRIRHVNPRAARIMGLQQGQVVRLPEAGRSEIEDFFVFVRQRMEEIGPQGQESVSLRDGSRTFLVSWKHLGRQRVMLSAADITAQREAEDKLANQIRSKDQFIATISHELRTPLSAVLGFLEEIAEDNIPHEEVDELMGLVLDHARDLADIVQDLLVAARADIGDLVINSREIDFSDVLRAVAATVPEPWVEVPDRPWMVVCDVVRVRQIVRNLLTNAIRYGGPNRRVRLEDRAGWVVFEVRDDGPPVEFAFREQMFAPYERAPTSKLPTESVGLGLTVARRLARLMKGDLTYDHDGAESVFSLYMRALPGMEKTS